MFHYHSTIEHVLGDVECFLTGEHESTEPDDTIDKIVIRRTTLEEDVELDRLLALGAFCADIDDDDEVI